MSQHKWQIGSVKLANGDDAFIDAINEGQEEWMYTGRVRSGGLLIATGWDASGRYMYAPLGSPYNLAPPPKKKVRMRAFINVFEDGSNISFLTKEEADKEAAQYVTCHRFALIEIDREVEEGEGL